VSAEIDFAARLRRYAEVIVRVGLNLRAGQRLLLAEPFELQGVARDAAPLVDAIRTAARAAGAVDVDVIWGDEARWRAAALRGGDRAFARELERNGERMRAHAAGGGALLFLQSSHPGLMSGVSAEYVARVREAGWHAYGRVAPDLIAGRTNWTTVPAPTAAWAVAVFPDAAPDRALGRLWEVVFGACWVDSAHPLAEWRDHLAMLEARRAELNDARPTRWHFSGAGTDLVVAPAPGNVWCTASLRTPDGRPFVANLPTAEVFTAPDCDSAEGIVRVDRPVAYGGGVFAGAELEFRRGRVVRARAARGEDLLHRLLATDEGASRLGEIALVPRRLPGLAADGTCFQLTLLDENALDHIALGEGYPFTVRASSRAAALNHSLIHVDLPLAAKVAPVAGDRR